MKILVIGEVCTDIQVYGTVDRICPEAPVPVINTRYSESTLGMAGNVKSNLEGLRSDWDIHLYCNDTQIIKRRFVDISSNYMILREDTNDKVRKEDAASVKGMMKKLKEEYGQDKIDYDAIVLSDYNKGFLSPVFISFMASNFECPIFMDTKKVLGDWSMGITFAKINQTEYDNNCKALMGFTKPEYLVEKLIVTKGELGAAIIDGDEEEMFSTESGEVYDVCGAGDTFLAGLVVKYLETKDIRQAVRYANKCAAVAVTHKGVVAVKKDWIE